jgi:hypothetical protein
MGCESAMWSVRRRYDLVEAPGIHWIADYQNLLSDVSRLL